MSTDFTEEEIDELNDTIQKIPLNSKKFMTSNLYKRMIKDKFITTIQLETLLLTQQNIDELPFPCLAFRSDVKLPTPDEWFLIYQSLYDQKLFDFSKMLYRHKIENDWLAMSQVAARDNIDIYEEMKELGHPVKLECLLIAIHCWSRDIFKLIYSDLYDERKNDLAVDFEHIFNAILWSGDSITLSIILDEPYDFVIEILLDKIYIEKIIKLDSSDCFAVYFKKIREVFNVSSSDLECLNNETESVQDESDDDSDEDLTEKPNENNMLLRRNRHLVKNILAMCNKENAVNCLTVLFNQNDEDEVVSLIGESDTDNEVELD